MKGLTESTSTKSGSLMVPRSLLALLVSLLSLYRCAAADPLTQPVVIPPAIENLLGEYCIDCHNSLDSTAGLDISSLTAIDFAEQSATWEKIVRKLRGRQMPPGEAERPSEKDYIGTLDFLEQSLDAIAIAHPQPGRTSTFRRLTRAEYQNSIRDLLGIQVDARTWLPADEVSQGFDNITVGELSPTLLSRYISAAQTISRTALARPLSSPDGKTFRVPADVTQEEHVAGLPLGTRGGLLVHYTFPAEGEYEIRIRLARDRNEQIEGLAEPHDLELLIDGERVGSFTVKPPRGRKKEANDEYSQVTHQNVDEHLVARFRATAGGHKVGATFIKNPSSLLETERQPLNVHYNFYRHPRLSPAIYQISITGPLVASDSDERAGANAAAAAATTAKSSRHTTPSRQKIFTCYPTTEEDEEGCAERIIAGLLRRACRTSITDEDLQRPMELYREARAGGTFEDGIEMALGSILVHPRFLFRIESDPADKPKDTPYRISDTELASRLSFLLWSSLPDDELLTVAERGELHQPDVLEQQTRRMLADPRSSALVENFAGQWLYLRNLDSTTPDLRLFPDFDDNLRQAFRTETELFFENVIREDRSVLELVKSDHTFLNERLAKHYGIPHVYGSHFRRVALEPDSHRGGLLRQGSILTVTSYATRTSPVIRGKWILENILGTPPPPPPPNVPALTDNIVSAKLPVRERLAQHRADPACASCHVLIDPPGFALENYDAVGRWRELDDGRPVDASGGMPDGSRFDGIAGVEQGLVDRPEMFVATLTEKLLTYSLGRGLEHYDAPAVRQILRSAAADDYRFSALVLGIVKSTPFQMRTSP